MEDTETVHIKVTFWNETTRTYQVLDSATPPGIYGNAPYQHRYKLTSVTVAPEFHMHQTWMQSNRKYLCREQTVVTTTQREVLLVVLFCGSNQTKQRFAGMLFKTYVFEKHGPPPHIDVTNKSILVHEL